MLVDDDQGERHFKRAKSDSERERQRQRATDDDDDSPMVDLWDTMMRLTFDRL